MSLRGNQAPPQVPKLRLVTTNDLGLVNHPGGEQYNRFTVLTSNQCPKLVPNHDVKSGYHSNSSRDEAV